MIAEARRVHLATAAVALFAFHWAVATFPTPARLLSDHGHGYQLAGASAILGGRHPFIHFTDIAYGPAMHYASAAAQWISGGKVGGELLLVATSFALGYALLFRLMLGTGIPLGIALTAAIIAILAKPESYRYQLLVWPVLILVAVRKWIERPTRLRLAAVAATATGAGLFRSDLGAIAFLTALVAMLAAGDGRRVFLRTTATLSGFVLAMALPWLVWLAVHGKLLAYLVNSSIAALPAAAGLARPPPPFDPSAGLLSAQNGKAFVFRLPWIILLFAVVMLVVRRAELRGSNRAWLLGAATLAALTTLHAAHIVDWFHVRDTLPVRIYLLAWIAVPAGAGVWQNLPRAIAATLGLTMAGASLAGGSLAETTPVAVVRKIAAYQVDRDTLLATVRASGATFRASLYEYVRDHSEPNEGSFAVLEAPQMNFFANRPFAGEQMAIFPGYFGGSEDQRRLIAQLKKGRTAFVVLDHLGQPEYPDMSLEKFAPEFHAFLRREFVEVAAIGYCLVLTPRWRKGEAAVEFRGAAPTSRPP